MESILLSAVYKSWVRNSTWLCCEIIALHFLTRESVIVIGDIPVQLNQLIYKPFYTYRLQPIPYLAETDLLLVHQGSWNGTLPKMTARGLILTDSLEFAHKLVTRNRINPQVVVLQSSDKCDVFMWDPYKPENCRNSPQLQWISDCDHVPLDKLEVSIADTSGCPLLVSLVSCPVYVEREVNRTLRGAEIAILGDLAHYTGMEFVPHIPPLALVSKFPRLWYYTKYDSSGALSGVWALVDENVVDLGGACQSMGDDKLPLACLPSHIEDVTAWHLPTALHAHLSYGFITAMPMDLWLTESVTFIAAAACAYGISFRVSFGSAVVWTFARTLSMPNHPLRNNFSFRLFSIALELGYLVLTSSYRSFLLYNLFLKPVWQIQTGVEGAEEGLYAYIRIREAELLNNSQSHLRNVLIEKDTLVVAQTYDYEKLVIAKTAMIMARTILDQAQIRRMYPNITYTSAVYVDKNTFTTNRVVFLMQPYHPLFSKLEGKMLEIIESGLPEVYLQRSLAELPGSGFFVKRQQHERSLGISELASVFYLWLIGIILCIAAIVMEIIHQAYFGYDTRIKPANLFQLRLRKIMSIKY